MNLAVKTMLIKYIITDNLNTEFNLYMLICLLGKTY